MRFGKQNVAVGVLVVLAMGTCSAFAQNALEKIHVFDEVSGPPFIGIVVGEDGVLYGKTSNAIFRINSDGSDYSVLRATSDSPVSPDLGYLRDTGLLYSTGNLYGTTEQYSPPFEHLIFRMASSGAGYSDESNAWGGFTGFTLGPNGKIFGGTYYGTIFSLNTDGSGFVELAHLSSGIGSLVVGSDGALYGALSYGGSFGSEGIFRLNTDGAEYSQIKAFQSVPTRPMGTLLTDGQGYLYGMTHYSGNSGVGCIYAVREDGSEFTELFDLVSVVGYSPVWFDPAIEMFAGSLAWNVDGGLLAVVNASAIGDSGRVFKMNVDGSGIAPVWEFSAEEGYWPSKVSVGEDHSIYGTCMFSSYDNYGSIFKIATDVSLLPLDTGILHTPVNSIVSGRHTVRLLNGDNLPVSGFRIEFLAPEGGSGGQFLGDSVVVTDADGYATAPDFLANDVAGTYQVTARLLSTPQVALAFDQVNTAPPVAVLLADTSSATVGQNVTFNCVASDLDGGSLQYEFDFNAADGIYELPPAAVSTLSHAYAEVGLYTAMVRVTDDEGEFAVAQTQVTVKEMSLYPEALKDAVAGHVFSENIVLANAEGQVAFEVVQGALPPGFDFVVLDGNRWILTGEPQTPGMFEFTLIGTDETGASVQRAYRLRVVSDRKSAPYAYVPNHGSNTVSVISTLSKEVVATLPVGAGPAGGASSPDGLFAFVANQDARSFSWIDRRTLQLAGVLSTTGSSEPTGVVVSKDGKTAWVTCAANDHVIAVDLKSGAILAEVPVGILPSAIELSPDGVRAYVSCSASNEVSVLDIDGMLEIARIPVSHSPEGLVSSPDGAKVYVACSADGQVDVLDTATNTITGSIPVGYGPGAVALGPDGRHLYVALRSEDQIAVLDTITGLRAGGFPSQGHSPVGVAVRPDGAEVWVLNYDSSTATVFDAVTGAYLTSIGVGQNPYSLAAFIGPEQVLSFTPEVLPGGREGEAYQGVFHIGNGTAMYGAEVISGDLPPGLELTYFHRNPASDDPSDLDGDSVIDINDNSPKVANFDQADMDGDGIGDAGDPDPFTNDGLFSPRSFQLTGVPSVAGTYSFTIAVTDSQGVAGSRAFVVGVLPPQPRLQWTAPAPITYGEPIPAEAFNAVVVPDVPGAVTYNRTVGEVPKAGFVPLTATFTPDDLASYEPVSATVLLTVNQAPLEIQTDDKQRYLGEANPLFSASYADLVNGDIPEDLPWDVTFTCEADETTQPGVYPVLASADVKSRMKDFGASKKVYPRIVVDGTIYFVVEDNGAEYTVNLWKADAGGVEALTYFGPGQVPILEQVVEGVAYLRVYDDTQPEGSTVNLWRADSNGVAAITDLPPNQELDFWQVVQGLAYFVVTDNSQPGGPVRNLWKVDSGGAVQLTHWAPGESPDQKLVADGTIYFALGANIWKVDGSGVTPLTDVGSDQKASLWQVIEGEVYFTVDDIAQYLPVRRNLWKVVPGGITQLTDLGINQFAEFFQVTGDAIYYGVNDQSQGEGTILNLWKATPGGCSQLTYFGANPSIVSVRIEEGTVYFSVFDSSQGGNTTNLWKADENGVSALTDFGANYSIGDWRVANGIAYIRVTDTSEPTGFTINLWRSGPAGITQITDFGPNRFPEFYSETIQASNGAVYFDVQDYTHADASINLWRADSSGAAPITDFGSGNTASLLMESGGVAYLEVGTDSGVSFWQADGTGASPITENIANHVVEFWRVVDNRVYYEVGVNPRLFGNRALWAVNSGGFVNYTKNVLPGTLEILPPVDPPIVSAGADDVVRQGSEPGLFLGAVQAVAPATLSSLAWHCTSAPGGTPEEVSANTALLNALFNDLDSDGDGLPDAYDPDPAEVTSIAGAQSLSSTLNIPAADLPEGDYVLELDATDNFGNSASDSAVLRVYATSRQHLTGLAVSRWPDTPLLPMPSGEVIVTATASTSYDGVFGDVIGVQYRFFRQVNNGAWLLLRDWGTDGSASVSDLEYGYHRFYVEARLGNDDPRPTISNYSPMPDLAVGLSEQAIAFDPIPDHAYGDAPFALLASSTFGLPVSFEIVSGPATVLGNIVTLTGTGVVIVRATQPGDADYIAAESVERSFTIAKGTQTIVFPPLPDRTYGDGPFMIGATASSGLPVAFTVIDGPATVTGDLLTLTGGGPVTVRASQAGDDNWLPAADVDQGFPVLPATQSIAFALPPSVSYSLVPYTLGAVASSGLPVSYTLEGGDGSISANQLTFNGTGTFTIRASQAGDADFLPALDEVRSFTVLKGNQAINFPAISAKQILDPAFPVQPMATSGLPVSLALVSGPATLTPGPGPGEWTVDTSDSVTGTVKLTATQGGDVNWNSAPAVTRTFSVTKRKQVISFANFAAVYVTDPPVALSAVTTDPSVSPMYSTLEVAYRIVSGPGTLIESGGQWYVLIDGAGTITVEASQGGDAIYAAAGKVTRNLTVKKLAQMIAFLAISSKQVIDAPFEVTASASSGLPVEFVCVSGPASVAFDPGAAKWIVTLDGTPGTVKIKANQAGDATWAAAPSITRSFSVGLLSQKITFPSIAKKYVNDAPFQVTATAGSGLPVSFELVSGPATVTPDGWVTLAGETGTVTIKATQVGDGVLYAAAPTVNRSFTVNLLSQKITFPSIPQKYVNDAPFQVTATAGSGLPVSFELVSGPATVTPDGWVTLAGETGTVSIKATQTGDGVLYAVASPVYRSFAVSLLSQNVTFAAISNKVYGAPPFTVTATSNLGADYPVTVSVLSGPAEVASTGTPGQYQVTLTGAGSVTLQAYQPGDTLYAPKAVSRTFTVAPAPTSTSLSSSANPSVAGTTVVLTATVGSSAGIPSGTVTYFSDGNEIGFAAVDGSGQATLEVPSPSPGSSALTAMYGGDADHAPSNSAPLIQN